MENLIDYSRQVDMHRNLYYPDLNTNILVVGCGGIGFWVGLMMAMYGYKRIYLFDTDKIDHSNLARLPVPPSWVGINKATALRRVILFLRPDCVVKVYPFKVKEDTKDLFKAVLTNLSSINVFDTTDNAVDQNLIFKIVSENDPTNYIKVGYEGFKVGAYRNYKVWTAADYQPGYRTTSANVFSSALAAVIGFFSSRFTGYNDVEFDVRNYITNEDHE